jgi:hypothetical protein
MVEWVFVVPFGSLSFEGLGNDNPVISSHELAFLVGMSKRLVDVGHLILILQLRLQLLVFCLHLG